MQSIKEYFQKQGVGLAQLCKSGALAAGVLVLLVTIIKVAVPSYGELREMWQEYKQQRAELEKLEEFAALHADYSAYEEAKYKELVQLKQRLQRLRDINQLQGQLQLLAAKQGVVLKNMQVLTELKQQKSVKDENAMNAKNTSKSEQGEGNSVALRTMQLKLELTGDYFAVLRWLRQVEKLQLAVQTIQIKGQGPGIVAASIVLGCPVVAF